MLIKRIQFYIFHRFYLILAIYIVANLGIEPRLEARGLTQSTSRYMLGVYEFSPPPGFFYENLAGEITFSYTKLKTHVRSWFSIKFLGYTKDRVIQLKTYSGDVYFAGENTIELHPKFCIEYAKLHWDSRMIPQVSWECGHLILAYKSENAFTKWAPLKPTQTLQTRRSQWLNLGELRPMPPRILGDKIRPKNILKFMKFSGAIVYKTALKQQGEEGDGNASFTSDEALGQVAIWGSRASNLLIQRDVLKAVDKQGNVIAKLDILDRIGDFIIARWQKKLSFEQIESAHLVYEL